MKGRVSSVECEGSGTMDRNVDGESPIENRMKRVLVIILTIEALADFWHVDV